MSNKTVLVIDEKATLGEGPCWDEKNQLLYWIDIEGKSVHEYNPGTKQNRTINVEQMIGALVLRKQGGAIVAAEKGFHYMELDTGKMTPIFDPESVQPNNRFNDGKCDPYGRFWAGTMERSAAKEQGALYCLDANGNVNKKRDNVSISNGLAWSLDNKVLYFIDTLTKKVVSFEFQLESGDIKNPKEVVHIPDGEGMPDGMTIDDEGNLWIAHWGGGKVTNWNPVTGELLNTIAVPALNVTSCVFGGEDLRDLYITTARTGTDEKTLRKYPHAGGVFKVRPGVKGRLSFRYNG